MDSRSAPKRNPAPRYPPAGDSRSTLADGALDFRVRNGNGYNNPSMGTGIDSGQSEAICGSRLSGG